MILNFQKYINGKPTNFIEKIWQSCLTDGVELNANDLKDSLKRDMHIIGDYIVGSYPAKRHTIREDKNNRWIAGMLIHFKQWAARPYHSENKSFAPVVKVSQVETIEIKYHHDKEVTKASVYLSHVKIGEAIWVNCQLKNSSFTLEKLIQNDGFDTVNEFFEYFDKDFSGKIIHWTDLDYLNL